MANNPKYKATLSYQDEITASKLKVIFNGTEYEVPREGDATSYGYGASSLANSASSLGAPYPFYIVREDGVNVVYVNAATGTTPFTLKIIEESLTTSECFEKAVKSVGGSKLAVNAEFDDTI